MEEAITAGGSGFLLKAASAQRLVGVRLVADGAMLLGPAVGRRLVEDFARRTDTTRRPSWRGV